MDNLVFKGVFALKIKEKIYIEKAWITACFLVDKNMDNLWICRKVKKKEKRMQILK